MKNLNNESSEDNYMAKVGGHLVGGILNESSFVKRRDLFLKLTSLREEALKEQQCFVFAQIYSPILTLSVIKLYINVIINYLSVMTIYHLLIIM